MMMPAWNATAGTGESIENPADLCSRAHVHGQVRLVGVESAEVDDTSSTGGFCRFGYPPGRCGLLVFEVTPRSHRVDQMVDDLSSGCGLDEAVSIVEIDAMDVDLVGPGHLFELVRRSHGNANVVAGLQKARTSLPPI